MALRVLAAALAAIALGLLAGRSAIDALLPLLTIVAEGLSAAFSAHLAWDSQDASSLVFQAQLVRPDAATHAAALRLGQIVTTGTHLVHALVPPVLALASALAWPQSTPVRQVAAALLGFMAAVVALAMTTPFLVVARVETLVLEHAARAGQILEPSWLVHWMVFTEGGGRWLLGLVLGTLCAQGVARWRRRGT